MTMLVFPVGHYLGPHFRKGSEEPAGHQVRLGPSLRWLGNQAELLAWAMAHGLGELAEDEPWTREVLVEHARDLADVDVAEAVAGLLERRLLAEADPDQEESAVGFARAFRLRPLMLSLGLDSEEQDAVLLGTPGEPVAALSTLGHEVWRTSHDTASLWHTCRAVAANDPAYEVEKLLPELLKELHGLLCAGVGYLDTV